MTCPVTYRKIRLLYVISFCVLLSFSAWIYTSSLENNKPVNLWEKTVSTAADYQRLCDHQQILQAFPSINYSHPEHLELSDFLRRQPIRGIQLSSHNGLIEFLEPASCTPIPTSLVLYNRIFKTGSETMGTHFELVAGMMEYVYTKQTTEDFYDQGISEPYPMIIEEGASIIRRQIFFNAHFYFRNDLRLQRTHTYINQVREPVARYISHYAYMHNARHRPQRRIQKMIKSGEWNDTIEECFEKEGQGCKHNIMTRFFCGPASFCKNNPKKALERAQENIVKYYAVVGLLEHFDITLKILQKRLPSFLLVIPRNPSFRENQASRTNANTVSDEMISRIKKANWADIALYNFLKNLFWRQVKACGIPETK